MKFFCTLDLSSSYWQIPVDEESEDLLTFMAPTNTGLGRYSWRRLPMGLSLSSDKFNKLVENALAKEKGLKNFVKLMDDILLYGRTLE